MKNYLLYLLLAFSVCTAYSQDNEHLKFMGIPINGPVDKFMSKMKDKGFDQANANEPSILKGMFAGDSVRIAVYGSPITKTSYSVIVVLYKMADWPSIKLKFNNIVDQYTIKYDAPIANMRDFDEPFTEGDGDELSAFKYGKAKYISLWKTDNGSITVMIFPTGEISISYADDINSTLAESEETQIIQKDI